MTRVAAAMSTDQQSDPCFESGIDAARRRLLRGSLAAPVVLTVAPGAAMAQTQSSLYRCVQNAPANGKEAISSTLSDTYYRESVDAFRVKNQNSLYFFTKENVVIKNGVRTSAPETFVINTYSGDIYRVAAAPEAQNSTTTPFKVIVRFDDYGNRLGFPTLANATESSWASLACATSILNAATKPLG